MWPSGNGEENAEAGALRRRFRERCDKLRLLPIQLATPRYHCRRDPQTALRTRPRELAANLVRFGDRRLTLLLRREGWAESTRTSHANIRNKKPVFWTEERPLYE